MAQFILVPDDVTGINNWTCSTGSDFVDIVDEDDTSTYIYETLQNGQINYTFANPGIPEALIDFNEDVTVSAFADAHYTQASATVDMQILTNGTDISLSGITVAVDDDPYPAYAGQATTTKSFGNDWDYAALQALQMKITCTGRPARFHSLRVSYIFFRVSYTALATADNSTFFGANF